MSGSVTRIGLRGVELLFTTLPEEDCTNLTCLCLFPEFPSKAIALILLVRQSYSLSLYCTIFSRGRRRESTTVGYRFIRWVESSIPGLPVCSIEDSTIIDTRNTGIGTLYLY